MYSVGQKIKMYSYRKLKQDEEITIKRKRILLKLRMIKRVKDNQYEFEIID